MRTARNIGFTLVIPLAYADEKCWTGFWYMGHEARSRGSTV